MDFFVAKMLIDVNSITSDRSPFFSAVIRFAFQMNRINNSAKSFVCSFIQFMCQYLLNLANSSCVTCFDSQIVTTSKSNEKWKIGALIFLSLSLSSILRERNVCNVHAQFEKRIKSPRADSTHKPLFYFTSTDASLLNDKPANHMHKMSVSKSNLCGYSGVKPLSKYYTHTHTHKRMITL